MSGRTVLVTGAASGIGAAVAVAFAEAGAAVCLVDRSGGDRLEAVRRQCQDRGPAAVAVQADVAVEDEVRAMFATARAALGPVDTVVNNAGILTEHPVATMPTAVFDEMIMVNLRSVFLCCREAVPSMIDSGFGRIINIASQIGQRGGAGMAHYAAAKAGVIGFTRSLARELGASGVTANCIAPGPVNTPLGAGALSPAWTGPLLAGLPLGRQGEPAEVAPSALLLASVPGGNLYTGQTLGPNCGDVML